GTSNWVNARRAARIGSRLRLNLLIALISRPELIDPVLDGKMAVLFLPEDAVVEASPAPDIDSGVDFSDVKFCDATFFSLPFWLIRSLVCPLSRHLSSLANSPSRLRESFGFEATG